MRVFGHNPTPNIAQLASIDRGENRCNRDRFLLLRAMSCRSRLLVGPEYETLLEASLSLDAPNN
jgi:hypothetical protein